MKLFRHTFLLLAILSANFCFGQASKPLLLSSGNYEISNQDWSNQLVPSPTEGMNLVRIIQFTRPLLQSEREYFELNLGEILNYIPKNAYLVVLKNNLELSSFQGLPVHGITRLTPEMKMNRQVYNIDIPEYAWRGENRIEVIAGFHPYVNLRNLAQQFNSDGFQVLEVDERNMTISFEIEIRETYNLAAHPAMLFLQQGEAPEIPENINATRSARSRAITNRFSSGRHYDGSGVVIGHGDDGDIGPHIDYQGRIIKRNTDASFGDHGDHVAGTIFGAGNLNPLARGMAPGANLYYYRYPRNLTYVDFDYVSDAVRITNSSYSDGCNAGYTSYTQQVDQDIVQNPKLLHVFSAGNSGTSNCGYGAGSGWGNITGGHKIGKNVIATANVTANDQIASSSSRGPSADGRIKPDVSSVGSNVYSTINPNTYGYKTGTSMAAPGVAGSAAQVFQAFVENQGTEPDGGLVKAFIMNTADDLGNSGPDFIYGYGRINNLKAVRDIENSQFIIDSISTNEVDSFLISIPANTAQFKVMVYWTDPAATPLASRALVNDLNASVRVIGGSNYLPWVLDPTPVASNLNAPAVRAIDSLNNVEQITIENPTSGDVMVRVEGTNIPLGPQKYYIVYSYIKDEVEITYPFGGEPLIAGTQTEIYWDASDGNTSFLLEYSTNNGANWNTIITRPSTARKSNWIIPSGMATDQALIRITRGSQVDVSDTTLVIIKRPDQLGMYQACPDSITINWRPVVGASEYEVYTLGNKYMDPIGRTTDTFFVFNNFQPTTEFWYAVSAVPSLGGAAGERTIAKQKLSGLQNCMVAKDLGVFQMVNPQSGDIASCHNLSSIPVIVELRNDGLAGVDTLPIAYSLNGNMYRDTIYQFLQSYATTTVNLTQTLNANTAGSYFVKVWTELSGDGNSFNDTAIANFTVYSANSAQTLPFVESFDNWSTCGTSTDCGTTICALQNDFVNLTNDIDDDIDWRTHNGSTSSANTGPTSDHTLGNSLGNYLYLEASNCFFSEAKLQTPCINLGTAIQPELTFWYNMNGADIGELHVDVFSEGLWTKDVISPIIGNQGTSWIQASANLLPWSGKIVSVRFRGSTGATFMGDMALDDIQIAESSTAPSADFFASNTLPCPTETVILHDISNHVATSWNWTITPGTFTYVNGTNSTSQNPEVLFSSTGSYTVKLIASNSIGTDSISKLNYININSGSTLPVVEDFQTRFAPSGWTILNPDNQLTWESQSCLGSDGSATLAAKMNNYTYGASGQMDALESSSIDLTSSALPALVFDVSYAGQPLNSNDRLRIEVSTDCGQSWISTGYDKTGNALKTTGSVGSNYIPTSAAAWRQDTVDLSAYTGQSLKLRFVNITDGGNNTYIDNIQLYDFSAVPPSDSITYNLADSCFSNTMTFSYNGNTADLSWNFGSGASPANAVGAGPHSVNYNFAGSKKVTMTATNLGGRAQSNLYFILGSPPIARFNFSVDPLDSMTVNFSNTSLGTITNYLWDFDDNGATSTLANPSHTYTQGGNHNVELVVENRCGPDTLSKTVSSIGVSENAPISWILSPNPAYEFITLQGMDESVVIQSSSIYNIQGQRIVEHPSLIDRNALVFDVRSLPNGVYFLRIGTLSESYTYRFIVNR